METPITESADNSSPIFNVPLRRVAGFWRRFFAFAIDAVILTVIGLLVTTPFFDFFSDLGPAGRLVGFFIALLYFALPESSLGHGAGIGKRLLRLRVVNCEGKALSIEESLIRYCVFAVPWFLNEMQLPVSRTPWAVFVLLGVVVFGVGGANLYLLIFNRNTRQGLHDLSVKSFVVMADESGQLTGTSVWRPHLWVALSLFVVLGAVPGVIATRVMQRGIFPQLMSDLRLIEQMEGVQQAGVYERWWRNASGTQRSTTLLINVDWRGDSADQEAFADQVVKTVIENDPKTSNFDFIRVVIIRGYDIGIAHASRFQTFTDSPAKWREELFGGEGQPGAK